MEDTTPCVQAPTWTSRKTVLPRTSLPPLLQINDWITNNSDKSILTTSSLFCNSSLLQYSYALFILVLTCCLFLYVLSLSFSCSLICAHSALFTFSPLFIFCSLSSIFLHTAHTVILPFYSSTHFSVKTTNLTQSLHVTLMLSSKNQLQFESPRKMPQQLNCQTTKNYDLVLLTK